MSYADDFLTMTDLTHIAEINFYDNGNISLLFADNSATSYTADSVGGHIRQWTTPFWVTEDEDA